MSGLLANDPGSSSPLRSSLRSSARHQRLQRVTYSSRLAAPSAPFSAAHKVDEAVSRDSGAFAVRAVTAAAEVIPEKIKSSLDAPTRLADGRAHLPRQVHTPRWCETFRSVTISLLEQAPMMAGPLRESRRRRTALSGSERGPQQSVTRSSAARSASWARMTVGDRASKCPDCKYARQSLLHLGSCWPIASNVNTCRRNARHGFVHVQEELQKRIR